MSQSQNQPSINPAWQALLAKVPAEYHNQILPDLKSWEQGVQQRFQEIHTQYEEYTGYKALIDNNIDPEYAMQSVQLADNLQKDPQALISRINEAWDLGFVSKEEAAKLVPPAGESTDDEEDFLTTDDDLMKNPKIKAMYDTIQAMQSETEKQKREREENEAIQEFETELDALEKKCEEDKVPFHRTFVTALIAQGVEADEAVKQYHQILAGNVNLETPNETPNSDSNESGAPIVMGNGGTQGSGSPDGSVDYGSLNRSDFEDTVANLLAESMKNNQG